MQHCPGQLHFPKGGTLPRLLASMRSMGVAVHLLHMGITMEKQLKSEEAKKCIKELKSVQGMYYYYL